MKIYNNPVLIRTNTYPKRNEVKKVQYSPSFKAIDPGTIKLLLILKRMSDMIGKTNGKGNALNELKGDLVHALQAPQECKKSIPRLLDNLAKVSDKIEHSFFYNDSGYESLSYYKKKALTELLPAMDDKYLGYRAAKKNYLTELAKSDEFVNQDFVDAFEALPDNYYQNFKLELIEKLLLSSNKGNNKNARNMYIFKMLKGLDNDNEMNKNCLQRNSSSINNLRTKMFNNMYSEVTSSLNNFYYVYTNMDNLKKNPDFSEIDTLFYSLAKNIKSLDEFKEIFKLGTNAANDIIKDLNTISIAKKNPNKAEQLLLYKKRLQEKFDANIIGEYDETFPGTCMSDRFDAELSRLWCKRNNIANFIKKTGYQDELNSAFKDKLNSLNNRIKEVERRQSGYNQSTEDDLYRYAHTL